MPQLVLAAAVEVVFFVSATLAAGGLPAFLLKVGGAALLSVISSKLLGPKIADQTANLREISVMTRSAVDYRKRVYGEAIVSGPIVYNNLSGTENQNLWYVISLCEGGGTEIESVEAVHIDGDAIPEADISWTPGASGADGTGTGDVSTAKWIGANSTEALQIFWTLGNDAQVAMSTLTSEFTDFTTNHRLRGISYLVVKAIYDADTEEIWRDGAPRNIRARVKGAKLYDPRLDSTQLIDDTTSPLTFGSGAHRTATASTWAWSDNPALCVADYLMNVMGVASTAIDWMSIAAAADDCEVSVDIPTASTEDRFTCNGVLSYGTSHKDNLDSLLSSCAGNLSYSGGTWFLRASVWEAAAVSFDDDDLAGSVQVQGSAPSQNRRNTIRGVFVDPNRNYEPVEFPLVTDSTYVTRDNGKTLYADLELPMTNTETMAQRIGFRILEQYDNQISVSLKLNARGAKLTIGDVFNLSLTAYSWTNKTFRCVEWNRNPDGTFDVSGIEDVSTRYTDPIEGDYSASNTGGVTYPAGVVPPPTGLAASVGASGGILLSWQNPSRNSYDWIDIYESATDQWAASSKIARVQANTYTAPVAGGNQRWYWIRAVREPDIESNREPNSDTSTIQATAASGVDGDDALAVNYTNNNHTVPVTNLGVETWTGSGGQFFAFEGTNTLTLATDTQTADWTGLSASEYNLNITKISGDTLTEPAITGATTTTATLADWALNLTTVTVYRISAYIKTADSTDILITTDVTLAPGDQGDDGGDGVDSLAISYTNQAHSVPVTNLAVEDWTGSGGLFYAYDGATILTLDQNAQSSSYVGIPDGEYRLDITKISGDTLTEPAITGAGTTTATLADWALNLTQVTVYRITAYIRKLDSTTFSLSVDVTLTPGDQGSDGADGDPGLPGANKITFFDDADTSISSTSAGKYGFGTSTTVGVLTWSTIVDGSSIIYFMVPNDSTGSTEDYEDYYTTIVAGDVLTWYDADAFPGRWVSWRTTGVGVAITGGYRFPVEFINYFDNGDTNDVPSAGANDVEVRWSRADGTGTPSARIAPIGADLQAAGSADQQAKFRIDSDGDVYHAAGNATVTNTTSRGTWLLTGAAADYECGLFELNGTWDAPTSGPALETWVACSTDREWVWDETGTAGQLISRYTVKWRDDTTLEILGQAGLDVILDKTL